ncbi:class I SAM-dependent methyltransferase [bacterium]|nr:class I SAM-dependent methyltransferase [bacterium]
MSNNDTYFQTRLSYEPERDSIWEVIVEYLQRYIPENAVILELGAGYCSFINQVRAKEKHALDRSEIIEKYAAQDVRKHIKDCNQLKDFSNNKFDVVFSSFLFEHLTREELNSLSSQLRRIMKPGGVLITLLPNFKYISRHYFDDYTHVQIFSHLSFADYLTSRGFFVTDVQGRFLPYSFKSRFPKSSLLTRIYLSLPFRPMAGNMLVVAVNPTSS